MAKYQAYSVLDTKAAAFTTPMFLQRDEMAIRAFSDAVKDPNHPMHKHPEDYHLYWIGEFDDTAGRLERDHNGGIRFLVSGLGEVQPQSPQED